MLGPRTLELLTVSSNAIGGRVRQPVGHGRAAQELAELLTARNGFYAFESALHVLPANDGGPEPTVEDWNQPNGWRASFDDLADGLLCFAEDAFGGQFALRDEEVVTFDPETGAATRIASSIEDWADQLMADLEYLTGHPVAHDWQVSNGALAPGKRLVPKIPFVLGGQYVAGNVYDLDAATGMRLRGELAVQLRDLPDGAKVQYRVVD